MYPRTHASEIYSFPLSASPRSAHAMWMAILATCHATSDTFLNFSIKINPIEALYIDN